jgi:hypothetical protein
MMSCWLIEFENGHKMIISENLYRQGYAQKEVAINKVLIESHWFNAEQCLKRNPEIAHIGV